MNESPRTQRLLPRWPALSLCLALAACLAACDSGGDAALPAAVAAAPVATVPQAVAVARGQVEVQGGLLELNFGQDGLVAAVAVQEGQSVRRGQVLAQLADAAGSAELAVAQAELRLSQVRTEAQAQRLPALRQTAGRLASAVRAGAVEPQRADEAQQALKDLEAEIQIGRAAADVARSRVALLQAQRARLQLLAPEDGTVLRVASKPGQHAVAGGAGVVLLPNRPLQVRAEVNESFIGKVHLGQQAAIATDGDAMSQSLPAARVVRISPVLGVGRVQDDNRRGPTRTVECILAFDSAPEARVGQNVKVSFHE
nr:HlyD family efflux transporter periplasmic adaptor subunit [Variovorax boronicumulans]